MKPFNTSLKKGFFIPTLFQIFKHTLISHITIIKIETNLIVHLDNNIRIASANITNGEIDAPLDTNP